VVRAQGLGNADGAVGLEMGLEHRGHGPGKRNSGPVQGVHQLRFGIG